MCWLVAWILRTLSLNECVSLLPSEVDPEVQVSKDERVVESIRYFYT